jgi:hypothetical protein
MAEKKATTGRLVLLMQDYDPEETLAYFKDMLDQMKGMLMHWCLDMHYMACTHMHLWLPMSQRVEGNNRQRQERNGGKCAARAEAVSDLQDVEPIYRKDHRFRRCMKKAA